MKSHPSVSVPANGLRRLIASFSIAAVVAFSMTGCGSKEAAEKSAQESPDPSALATQQPEVHGIEIKSVEMTTPLKPDWVTAGKAIYDMKCLSCHKLTGEKLVGPGWSGVTKRREPVWIMNMITNVDVMLAKDAEAQKLLELCLVRMPNMNVSADEARQLFEFMRSNDGEK